MKIAKSALIDPARNEVYGIFAVALSLFVFAYSSKFGQISILAYYAVWLPLVLVDYKRVLGSYSKYLWILAFGILCFVSSFWSQAPSASLRASIQYLTHIVCALIAMRTVNALTLTRGAIAGTAVVLLFSLADGTYLLDALDNSFSFVGAFSSKNQLGLYASLGLIFSAGYIMLWRKWGLWMIAAGFVSLLCAYCLVASQSATSVITTAGIIALCVGYLPVSRLSPRNRKAFFLAAIVLGTIGIVGGLQFGAIDAVLGVFGKDTTLTGRTYLWQQGIEAARQNPVFGVGYQAYWVIGFSEAERLWADFGIAGRSGFHFHETFIETVVETGFVGLFCLVSVLIANLVGHLNGMLSRKNDPGATLMCALSVLLLMRAFVEIDVIFPYQIGSFLMFYMAGYLTLPKVAIETSHHATRPTSRSGVAAGRLGTAGEPLRSGA
ncbi:MAG: O-antigen ligase [Neorhizobium sp.]|jgi:exopolysaccharide production protein ExoQ|nr:O-antigen ligase [Neorhizobium sp.]